MPIASQLEPLVMSYKGTTLVVLLSLLLAGACDFLGADSKDYRTYDGFYLVRSVNDARVPYTLVDNESCTVIFTGGWLELERSGEYELKYDERKYEARCPHSTVSKGRISRGTYQIVDTAITLTAGETTFEGKFTGGSVKLRSLTEEQQEYIFRDPNWREEDKLKEGSPTVSDRL